jgi:hypothetical protein
MVSRDFNSRIELERQIISRNLPQFRLYAFGTDRYFSGWQKTTVNHHPYKLKLNISPYYPDEKPQLYVSSPVTLYKYNSLKTINSLGVTHDFHTLSTGLDGCVQICHGGSGSWSASKTCVGVFMKGILWLEAYETHLITGKSIATILTNWQRRM